MQRIKVPWLTKKSIAAAAAGVIADYETKIKRRVHPPIPVEKIIERGLSLELAFYDLRKKLRLDDVLGATYVNERRICVDCSLTEDQNEGRLCFTFAHEAGHWVLHRTLVEQACRTGDINGSKLESTDTTEFEPDLKQSLKPNGCGAMKPNFLQDDIGGLIFCRIRDAKKPIEWQADYFASCMLMPEAAVRDAFGTCFGSRPLMLYNVKSAYCGPLCFDPCVETWPKIARAVREAGGFSNVSKQAMIIRLQDLGLVKNETQARLTWRESYVMA
jgi:Zn-dependent peptidase ImmA (M78 family)